MKIKTFTALSLIIVNCLLIASQSQAGWLIYHKPEYKGKIIDKETKEPIEGVVVAVYYEVSYYNIAGGGTRIINTRETLTDKNGDFVIPSYTTLMLPFNTSDEAGFIIYKPGYGGYPSGVGICKNPEEYFSTDYWGQQSDCFSAGAWIKFTYGVFELPKLKTREERLEAMRIEPSNCDSEDLPLLYQLINEERKRFGMGELK
jgi:hypothetical protein